MAKIAGYTPDIPPSSPDVSALSEYIQAELLRIAQSLQQELVLAVFYEEPPRPREGLIVLADGTQWNPGSGKGAYIYKDSAWSFLG